MTEPLECPECHVTVVPKRDGCCPACGYQGWDSHLSEQEELQRDLDRTRQEVKDLQTLYKRQRRESRVLLVAVCVYIAMRIFQALSN